MRSVFGEAYSAGREERGLKWAAFQHPVTRKPVRNGAKCWTRAAAWVYGRAVVQRNLRR